MLGTIAATPQFDTADTLKDVLDAEFAAHGLPIAVEVGEWDPEYHRGESRVMIQMGSGEVTEPRGTQQPGAIWPVTLDDGTAAMARAILDNAQGYTFKMHARAPSDVASKTARASRKAAVVLVESVLACLRRQHAAPMRGTSRVRWPKPWEQAPGYPAFVYGSYAEVDLVVGNPILDDAFPVRRGDVLTIASSIDFGDGTSTPPEAVTINAPAS